jgi:hypothetical protein
MAVFSLANRTSAAGSGVASLEIRAGASNRPRLLELGIMLNAATQSPIGLGRPQAIGITPTSPVTVLAEDPAESAGLTQTALAWGTGPTVPLNFFRRVNIAAAIGAGLILTFPRGLVIAAGNSLVNWNIAAVSVYDCSIVVDE